MPHKPMTSLSRELSAMTYENLTDTLARIHSAITRVLVADPPGLKIAIFEALENAEEELNELRTELSQTRTPTITAESAS
jgi:hypothetical protein